MAKQVVEEKEKEEFEGDAESMKAILEEKLEEAWRTPEGRAIKKKLSETAKKYWKPQIEEAIKNTKYDKELEARAREIEYDKKVKEVWK